MTTEPPVVRRFPRSVIPVWVLVAVGAVLVGLLVRPTQYFTWLPIVLVLGLIATFVIQLALDEKVGLVSRVIASLAGSVVILAVATLVLALLVLAAA